jgi:high-affinity nickel-transport protein
MYPVGALFGLGFDTATEIACSALAAEVATPGVACIGVISLPLPFAAGMSLIDTATAVLRRKAYGWALQNRCAWPSTTSPSRPCQWPSP